MSQLQSIVEPEVEFMEVKLKMFSADVVVDSTDPLFQIEDVPMKRFKVGSFSTDFHVVPLVNQGAQIALPSISGYHSGGRNSFVERLFERLSKSIFGDSGAASFQFPFFSRCVTAIDLDKDQYKTFFALAATTFSFLAASNKRFVNLNIFSKLNALFTGLHRQLNFALEKPCSLLVNVKPKGQLARAHALLCCRQEVNHRESKGQWKFDLVKQGVRGGRFIESAGRTPSVMTSAPFHGVRASTTATRESTAPFLIRQMRLARILAVELLNEFNVCQWFFHGWLDASKQDALYSNYFRCAR